MTKRHFKAAFAFVALLGFFLFSFQNCSYIGSMSSMDYYRLAAEDPHKDAWKPVHGLTVKDGEWVGIEQRVTTTARNTERNYVATVLYRAFLPPDQSTWTANPHRAIKTLIDDVVQKNFMDFGGPCFYTIQEYGCNGRNVAHASLQLAPVSSVFRASLKQQACDRLLQNDNVLKNFEANIKKVGAMLNTSDDMLFNAHQLFYLGQMPRQRTLASLDDLYERAQEQGSATDEGLRHVGLGLCVSTGWEVP
ncbi:MAG: hypothetical protein M9899_08675 [Bdellovibrionaceae bacterium]|nr:hypothetical protein [Pseudobdellovibrionaceae bacterium]